MVDSKSEHTDLIGYLRAKRGVYWNRIRRAAKRLGKTLRQYLDVPRYAWPGAYFQYRKYSKRLADALRSAADKICPPKEDPRNLKLRFTVSEPGKEEKTALERRHRYIPASFVVKRPKMNSVRENKVLCTRCRGRMPEHTLRRRTVSDAQALHGRVLASLALNRLKEDQVLSEFKRISHRFTVRSGFGFAPLPGEYRGEEKNQHLARAFGESLNKRSLGAASSVALELAKSVTLTREACRDVSRALKASGSSLAGVAKAEISSLRRDFSQAASLPEEIVESIFHMGPPLLSNRRCLLQFRGEASAQEDTGSMTDYVCQICHMSIMWYKSRKRSFFYCPCGSSHDHRGSDHYNGIPGLAWHMPRHT
jgi:hypothetical protein